MGKFGSKQVLTGLFVVALQLACGSVLLAADHDAHGYGGIKTDLAFWGVVAFVGFLVAIKFLGWDNLKSGMKSREQNERKLISDAESLRTSAHAELLRQKGQLESFDEQVREILEEAERDTVSTRQEIAALAQNEANTLHHRAEVEIGRVRDQSLNELFETMANKVADRTEQQIRDKFSSQDQEALLDFTLRQMAGSGA